MILDTIAAQVISKTFMIFYSTESHLSSILSNFLPYKYKRQDLLAEISFANYFIKFYKLMFL